MAHPIHVVCPHCDTVNRLDADRLAARPVCGRCRTRLFSGEPATLHDANVQRHLERNDIPVLVDCWAPWCGPCRTMAPAFAAAAAVLEPRVRLAKLNTETARRTAAAWSIQGIPTLILFQRGTEVARHTGAMSTDAIVAWTRSTLAGG